jgi:putative heme-binding domain-containing protein
MRHWLTPAQSGCLILFSLFAATAVAQDAHQHGEHAHDAQVSAGIQPPKVFLDKSPKVVEYQLRRLSNAELLLVERQPTEAKFAPVYTAILIREGMAIGERRAAAEALAELRSTSVPAELLGALDRLSGEQPDALRGVRDLTSLLLLRDAAELEQQRAALETALAGPQAHTRQAAVAALLLCGQQQAARTYASRSSEALIDFLAGVAALPQAGQRDTFREVTLSGLATSQPLAVRLQAIRTLATLAVHAEDSYQRLAAVILEPHDVPLQDQSESQTLAGNAELRTAVVSALLQLGAENCPPQLASRLVPHWLAVAAASPLEVRSSEAFLDLTQLAETLLPRLPDATDARRFRQQLSDIAVRVVRIRTVEEEMRYDLKYFAVEAGKPVEIMLINRDLMPHNLVVTLPGAVKEVALAAAAMAPDEAPAGKQYVPATDNVLFASGMVAAHKQERLAFTAPTTPGEYPYVCTYPNHWMRMVGVMVVVEDLEAWEKNPQAPADPVGSNRSFVRRWSLEDLAPLLETGLRGRSPEIGQRLFTEATCAQCHKLGDTGGVVGPDLTEVTQRWRGDRAAILREILEPSHKIDPRYATQNVLTTDGKVYAGIVAAEEKDAIHLVASPEQAAPLVIARNDIEQMTPSATSIMPTGLLDNFSQDEIFEILALLLR